MQHNIHGVVLFRLHNIVAFCRERSTHRKKVDTALHETFRKRTTDFEPGSTQWNSPTPLSRKDNITERMYQIDSWPPTQPLQARTNCISTKFAERFYPECSPFKHRSS